jgi:predicted nucleic acid-binding Zn ribbon protein
MEPLRPELERELRRLGGRASGALTELMRLWPQLVGAAIARNTCPARVGRDGTLHVHTSSSTWAFELTQLAPEIESRLRAGLGERAPARLRFAPGALPDGVGDDASGGSRPLPQATAEERARAAELTRSIEDSALRDLVARAAAASLAAAASDRRF